MRRKLAGCFVGLGSGGKNGCNGGGVAVAEGEQTKANYGKQDLNIDRPKFEFESVGSQQQQAASPVRKGSCSGSTGVTFDPEVLSTASLDPPEKVTSAEEPLEQLDKSLASCSSFATVLDFEQQEQPDAAAAASASSNSADQTAAGEPSATPPSGRLAALARRVWRAQQVSALLSRLAYGRSEERLRRAVAEEEPEFYNSKTLRSTRVQM